MAELPIEAIASFEEFDARWEGTANRRSLWQLLGQLEPADASDATARAIADRHYWLER